MLAHSQRTDFLRVPLSYAPIQGLDGTVMQTRSLTTTAPGSFRVSPGYGPLQDWTELLMQTRSLSYQPQHTKLSVCRKATRRSKTKYTG
jgi:hypothetical protein